MLRRCLYILAACLLSLCGTGLRAQTDLDTHLQRAREAVRSGKPKLATEEYEAVLATDPANVEAQANLGVFRFFDNDCTRASPRLTTALAANPAAAQIRALLAICQRRDGHPEEAEANLRVALEAPTSIKVRNLILTNLTELAYARGDLEQASTDIALLIKADPDSPDTLYLAYRIHTDLADAARNRLVLLDPDSARTHQLTAERYINTGHAAFAVEQYREALARDPHLPGIHYELGEAILQQSVTEDARNQAAAELQLALAEDPRNAGAEAKLGTIEAIVGHTGAAKEHFIRALTLDKNEFNALTGLGGVLRIEGDNEQAAQYLERAAQLDASDESLHFQLAGIYRALGRKADSEREMKTFAAVRALRSKTSLADRQRMGTNPSPD